MLQGALILYFYSLIREGNLELLNENILSVTMGKDSVEFQYTLTHSFANHKILTTIKIPTNPAMALVSHGISAREHLQFLHFPVLHIHVAMKIFKSTAD